MVKLSRKALKPCSKCRKDSVICSFKDNSDQSHIGDWVFEFSHYCTSCAHKESKDTTVGYDYDTKYDYICPFCGINWLVEISREKRKQSYAENQ